MSSTPAPGNLELVRSFVNTWDAEERTEALESPAALGAWLAEHGLLPPGAPVDDDDLAHALRLREALRATLLANGGVELDPSAPAELDAAARRAALTVRFATDGTPRTEPLARGADGALGWLLAIVASAVEDDTWPRLKACLAEDCQWAYYDRSRNRSAVWCDMRVCGNRQKVRSYRERHQHSHAAG
jgi:predicted RNA-binding Zn ribbon-like protein